MVGWVLLVVAVLFVVGVEVRERRRRARRRVTDAEFERQVEALRRAAVERRKGEAA